MANQTRAGVPGQYLTPYNLTVSYGNQGAHIIQNNGADWFGPLDPIAPTAPQEVKGRTWDFPSGYNLNTQPRTYEPVTFHTLRALADGYDVLRLVIETRKDQVSRMSWSIKSRDPKRKDKADPRIDAYTTLLKHPDGIQCWTDWLRSVLEDLFVIDAPALYLERTNGGTVYALRQIDGAIIKPVIDDWGQTPQPLIIGAKTIYPTAYQAVLKGIPATDYSTRDLIYRPRNKRINHAYGFSPVEQVMTTVNIALRRQLFTLSYFTDGNIPDSFIPVPPEWTPDQIITYQKNFDAYFTGDLAARRRAKFVPGGVGKGVVETKQPELTGEFDNFLHRIICFAFSVSPQALTKMMNRASAETQKESAEEEGVQPILEWIKTLIDELLDKEFDAKDLEFAWNIDDEVDRTTQQTILTGYVSKGIMTIDESRDELGLDPFNTPESSQPMIITATGMVPLDSFAKGQQQAAAQLQANAEAKAKMEANGGLQPAQGDGKNGKQPPATTQQDDTVPGKKKPAPKVGKAAKKPLYVSRNLTNADDLITWAKSQGFAKTLAADDLHVTVCYSKRAVDWSKLTPSSITITVSGGARKLETFGQGAIVLQFESSILQAQHEALCESGASFDYPEYRPHVTITYDAGDVDLDKVAPYTGPLNFGPEIFAEIDDDDWSGKLTEEATKLAKRSGGTAEDDPFSQEVITTAEDEIAGVLTKALSKVAGKAAKELRAKFGKLAKAEPEPDQEDRSDRFADDLSLHIDLSDLHYTAPDISESLSTVARYTVETSIAQIGVSDPSKIVDQVNPRAVAAVQDRGAELVGMVKNADGEYVVSSNAEMAITDTTRAALRSTISEALADNVGLSALIETITESFAFSPKRAALIAQTEVARANGLASLMSYKAVQATGVTVKKRWLTAPVGCCDICGDNAEQGPIELTSAFESGDQFAPAHPRCRCRIVPVVGDGK